VVLGAGGLLPAQVNSHIAGRLKTRASCRGRCPPRSAALLVWSFLFAVSPRSRHDRIP